MTRRELLEEQYEEALFALLMDDYSIEQGKLALEENEKLKDDPAAAIPLSVQKRCLKQISKHFSRQRLCVIRHSCYILINRVAIIVLVVMLLFTTAFAVSPTFRINALNLAIETFYDRTNFQLFEKDLSNCVLSECEITANWLPEGYVLMSQSNDSRMIWNSYQSQNGKELQINATTEEGMILSIDTEKATTKVLELHGIDALLSQKDGIIQIVWNDKQTGTLLALYGEDILESDAIRIAENISIK